MRKPFYIILLLLFTSCASSLNYKMIGDLEISRTPKSKTDNFVYYSKKDKTGEFSEFQRYRHGYGFQCYINKEFKKKSVTNFLRRPSYVESLTKAKYKKIDHDVELLVFEDIKKESFWSKVLRTIALGFYPQKIEKKILLTVKSKNEVVKREFYMNANVYSPFNFIPLDFNNSVYILRDEGERYAKEFYEMLNIH